MGYLHNDFVETWNMLISSQQEMGILKRTGIKNGFPVITLFMIILSRCLNFEGLVSEKQGLCVLRMALAPWRWRGTIDIMMLNGVVKSDFYCELLLRPLELLTLMKEDVAPIVMVIFGETISRNEPVECPGIVKATFASRKSCRYKTAICRKCSLVINALFLRLRRVLDLVML